MTQSKTGRRKRPTEFDQLREEATRYGLRLTKVRAGYRLRGLLPDNRPSATLSAEGGRVILLLVAQKRGLLAAEELHSRQKAVSAAYYFRKIDHETALSLEADIQAEWDRLDRDNP